MLAVAVVPVDRRLRQREVVVHARCLARDLELDSLSTLEMLMEIEEAVGIELDPELLPELVTLDALVEHIMASRADA